MTHDQQRAGRKPRDLTPSEDDRRRGEEVADLLYSQLDFNREDLAFGVALAMCEQRRELEPTPQAEAGDSVDVAMGRLRSMLPEDMPWDQIQAMLTVFAADVRCRATGRAYATGKRYGRELAENEQAEAGGVEALAKQIRNIVAQHDISSVEICDTPGGYHEIARFVQRREQAAARKAAEIGYNEACRLAKQGTLVDSIPESSVQKALEAVGSTPSAVQEDLWLVVPTTSRTTFEVHSIEHVEHDEQGPYPYVIADQMPEDEAKRLCAELNRCGVDPRMCVGSKWRFAAERAAEGGAVQECPRCGSRERASRNVVSGGQPMGRGAISCPDAWHGNWVKQRCIACTAKFATDKPADLPKCVRCTAEGDDTARNPDGTPYGGYDAGEKRDA